MAKCQFTVLPVRRSAAPLGPAKPDWMPAKYGFHRPVFHDSVNQSLVGALEDFLFSNILGILGIIIPTD